MLSEQDLWLAPTLSRERLLHEYVEVKNRFRIMTRRELRFNKRCNKIPCVVLSFL